MYWFYKLAQYVTMTIFLLWFDMKYEGIENIPDKKSKYIVICNHRSIIDPIFISWYIPRMVRFMGKAELFKKNPLKWFCEMVGGFPIERGIGDMGALDYGINLYKEGYPIGIFPEGTRGKSGEPLRPKSGVALVARMAEADVLPCAIIFGEKLSFRTKITIKYGKIVKYKELGFETDSPRELKRATKVMWDPVLELLSLEGETNGDNNR